MFVVVVVVLHMLVPFLTYEPMAPWNASIAGDDVTDAVASPANWSDNASNYAGDVLQPLQQRLLMPAFPPAGDTCSSGDSILL